MVNTQIDCELLVFILLLCNSRCVMNLAVSFQLQSKEAKILGYKMCSMFRLRTIRGSEKAVLC